MSYARWSSIIDVENLSKEEWVNLHTSEWSLEEQLDWCRQNKNPEAYLSEWYIFWHSDSDAEGDAEDQYLALWKTHESLIPVVDYDSVKAMLEKDDWSALGFETITQKDLLVGCAKQWIQDVQEEYTEVDTKNGKIRY